MPPKLLLDPGMLADAPVLMDRETIYEMLPQQGSFAQLDALIFRSPDGSLAAARRLLRNDEFWVPDHVPGRPLFPGVLMIEAAGQLASLAYRLKSGDTRFLGFGGVDGVRFRGAATVGDEIIFVAREHEIRSRKIVYECQAVASGKLIFEGRIIGMHV